MDQPPPSAPGLLVLGHSLKCHCQAGMDSVKESVEEAQMKEGKGTRDSLLGKKECRRNIHIRLYLLSIHSVQVACEIQRT